jgi:hypothetical protein
MRVPLAVGMLALVLGTAAVATAVLIRLRPAAAGAAAGPVAPVAPMAPDVPTPPVPPQPPTSPRPDRF